MPDRALLIVDLQNDYFEGGKCPLAGVDEAACNASLLLGEFRQRGWPVVHVRHEFDIDDAPFFEPGTHGAKVHPALEEVEGEPVVMKHQVNSFSDTSLKSILDELNVDRLLICGAMSHMCIEAAARAASDFGYFCAIAHDACATMDLSFKDTIVPAKHVHAASMAALGFGYAYVASTKELVAEMI